MAIPYRKPRKKGCALPLVLSPCIGLDVLVNNAGVLSMSSIAEQSTEEAQRVMNLNYMSPLVLTREALPHVRKTQGNVVFISSVGGTRTKE